MAIELATGYVSILPSTRGFGKALQGDLDKEIAPAGDKAGRSLGSRLGGALKTSVKVGAVGAGVAAGAAVMTGFKSAMNQETAEKTLAGLYGSAGKAESTMKGLAKVASKSPIDYQGYQQAAQSLAYAGVEGDKAIGILKNVGLAITASGGSTENMDSATDAVLKMVNAGKVQLDTLQQLSDSGVPILSGLAEHFDKPMAKVNEMASAGKIGLEDVLSVMQNATGSTFKQMKSAGQEASKSFSNQWKIAKDNVSNALGRVMLPAVESLTPALSKIGQQAPKAIEKIASAVGPVASTIGGKLKSAFTSIPWGSIATQIGAVATGFVTWVRNSSGLQTFITGLSDVVRVLWGQLTGLFSALRDSASGGVLAGVLTAVKVTAEGLLTVLGKLGSWLAKHIDVLKVIAAGLLAYKATLIATTLATKAVALATKVWAIAQRALNLVLAANPIGLVVAAIVALGAALVLAYKKSDTFRAIVDKAWAVIKKAVVGAWNTIKPALKALWGFIQKYLIPIFKTYAKLMVKYWTTIAKIVKWAWSTLIKPALKALWSFIKKYLVPIFKKVAKVAGTVFKAIGKAVAWAWNNVIKPAFKGIWNFIKKYLVPIFTVYYKTVWRIMKAVGKVIASVWNNVIKPAFKALWSFIKKYLVPAFTWAKDKVKSAFTKIGNSIKWVWDNVIKPAFNTLKEGVRKVGDAFTTVKETIAKVWGKIKGIIRKPIVGAIDIINTVMIKPINDMAEKLPGVGKNLIPKIKIPGFDTGGYTGRINPNQAAGIVHGDEHVIRSRSRRRLEAQRPGALDYMNNTGLWPGYKKGGKVKRVMPLAGATFSTYAGHTGVDLNAPNDLGKPVLAAAPGVVTSVKSLTTSYGKHVWIDHGGVSAVYGHLSGFSVRPGMSVGAGAQIGTVGSTGNSTGPHLHFEVRPGGTYASSVAFLKGASSSFAGASASGTAEAQSLMDKVTGGVSSALSNVKDKLASVDGFVGDMVRGVASMLGDKLKSVVLDKAGSVFDKLSALNPFGDDKPGKIPSDLKGGKTPSQARAIGKASLVGYGWSNQWSALDSLWTRESGWRWNADNPSSSAYGIPQALPGSKMASAGSDWRTNPITQIKWGLNYIRERYGSPNAAWAHSQRVGWYDKGGWLKPGTTVATNKTGKPEAVLTNSQWSLLRKWLPGRQTSRDRPITLKQLEAMTTKVLDRYGVKSRKYQKASRWVRGLRFSLDKAQWGQLKKWTPKLAKKAGRPDTIAELNKFVRRIRKRFGTDSRQYKRARQMQAEARLGGQYTGATWDRIRRDLIPQVRKSGTANAAAKQILNLVTKTFGPHSPISRQVTRLAGRVKTTVEKITGLNNSLTKNIEQRDELATTVRDAWRADAFGNGLESLRLTLAANTNDARAFGAALKTASAKGLSGGLFKALASSGDIQTAKEIANLSRAEIAALEKQWAQRNKVTTQIGNQIANTAYGPEIKRLRTQIQRQNQILNGLSADIRQATYAGTKAGIQGTTRSAKAKSKTGKGKRK